MICRTGQELHNVAGLSGRSLRREALPALRYGNHTLKDGSQLSLIVW